MQKQKRYIAIIGLLCFITAACICVQYRSVLEFNKSGKVVTQSMTENKLRDNVMKANETTKKLTTEIQIAQKELEDLRKNSSANNDEAQKLEEELTELNKSLGYTDVTGQGIVITLKDAASSDTNTINNIIHDLDLVEVVNELFNAGAEAVSINDQRIISISSINCTGNVVKINNQKISVPFVVRAVGNSEELKQTMTRPNGCLDFLQRFSIGVKVEEKSEITVPKYTGTRQYEYLQIAE